MPTVDRIDSTTTNLQLPAARQSTALESGLKVLGQSISAFAEVEVDELSRKLQRDEQLKAGIREAQAKFQIQQMSGELFSRTMSEPGFSTRSKNELVADYATAFDEQKELILEGLEFDNPLERDLLSSSLDNFGLAAQKSLVVEQSKRLAADTNRVVEEALSVAGNNVLDNPASLFDEIQSIKDQVEPFTLAMGPERSRDVMRGAVSGLIENAVQGLRLQERFDEATGLLNGRAVDPVSGRAIDFRSVLDPDERNRLLAGIETDRVQALDRHVRALERQEDRAEKELREAQGRNYAVLVDRILEGAAGDRELDTALNGNLINANDYIAARKLLNGEQAVQDDPRTVVVFETLWERGELDLNMVLNAAADGFITLGTMQSYRGRLESRAGELERRALKSIREQVGGVAGPLAVLDTQSSIRVANATAEFWQRVGSGEDAQIVADDVVRRYRTQEPGVQALPAPRFLVGTRVKPNLEETGRATIRAFEAGEISEDELNRESELLKQLERLVDPSAFD